MELTMIQQQRFGTGLLATPAAIVSETGVMGMFRGFWMSCGREGIFAAGYMGLGPSAGNYIAVNVKPCLSPVRSESPSPAAHSPSPFVGLLFC